MSLGTFNNLSQAFKTLDIENTMTRKSSQASPKKKKKRLLTPKHRFPLLDIPHDRPHQRRPGPCGPNVPITHIARKALFSEVFLPRKQIVHQILWTKIKAMGGFTLCKVSNASHKNEE